MLTPTGYPPHTHSSRHGPQHTAHSQHCGHTALPPGQKTNPRRRAHPTQTVYAHPFRRLQGCWRSVERRSLTQSSARLGYAPIQLELSYRLRRALGRDRQLCEQVAAAFAASEPACVGACR